MKSFMGGNILPTNFIPKYSVSGPDDMTKEEEERLKKEMKGTFEWGGQISVTRDPNTKALVPVSAHPYIPGIFTKTEDE